MSELFDLIKSLIEKFAPALAVAIWNYEETKVAKAESEKELAEEQLQVEKNHEAIDAANAGKSDSDIVNDAIINGGGSGGQLKSGDEPDRTAPATGDNGRLEQAKPKTGS